MIVSTDDITEINGDTSLWGQHLGFCVRVRQPDFWLCEAGYILPGIQARPSRTVVNFRPEECSNSPMP
jgi:hypothetical protein